MTPGRKDLEHVKNYVEGRFSNKPDPINELFASYGMTETLKDDGNPLTFYVGAVTNIFWNWLQPGTKKEYRARDNNLYMGVKLPIPNIQRFRSPHCSEPVFRVKADKSELAIYLTPYPQVAQGQNISKVIKQISETLQPENNSAELLFPAIDLNIVQTPEYQFLLNMFTYDQNDVQAWISQIIKQVRLQINEISGQMTDAAGAGITLRSLGPEVYVIKDPFLLWITINYGGLKPLHFNLLDAHLTQDVWKYPGDIKESKRAEHIR